MKIHPMEPSCSMQTGEQLGKQTDMIKLIVFFSNFANALKIRTKGRNSIVPVDHLQ